MELDACHVTYAVNHMTKKPGRSQEVRDQHFRVFRVMSFFYPVNRIFLLF